jgi:hypothetical protein
MVGAPARDLGLALILGVSALWIIAWLSPYVAYAELSAFLPVVSVLAQEYGWTKDQIWPLHRAAAALSSALAYGFVVGFPLGIMLSRRWLEPWLAFLVAYLIAHWAAATFFSPLGVGLFVANLLLPEFWLTLLGTLLFTFVGYRARQSYVSRRARA